MRLLRSACVLVVGLGLLAGCGSSAGEPLPERLPAGSTVSLRDVAWASGRTVHVGDRTVRAPAGVEQVAVTTGGLYLRAGPRLLVVTGDRVRDTGQRLRGGFVVDPAGRHLAYLDASHGPRDDFGTRRLTAVLWDLRTHTRVADSSTDLGDPGSDDLTDLYEETEPRVLGFVDDSLVVGTTDGYRRIALSDGRERGLRVEDGTSPLAATQGGFATSADRVGGRWRVDPFDGRLAVLSPTRRFLLVSEDGLRWIVTDRRGRPFTVPGLPRVVQPGPWLDDYTLTLIAFDAAQDPTAILRCDLAARRCTDVARGPVLGDAPVLGSQTAGQI
ncbi:MAG: hypothetical protein PGN07_12590 [Aeromicrobium erythreum]